MKDDRFSVFILAGDFRQFMDLETEYLRFDRLLWPEVETLCQIAFGQRFQVVILPKTGEVAT